MTDPFLPFTLFYVLFCACFILKYKEFVSAGITVECLFSSYLGSEPDDFILFHIRRSSLTLLVHCLLPIGYILSSITFLETSIDNSVFLSNLGLLFLLSSVILPSVVSCLVWWWFRNDYESHPLVLKLKVFCDSNTSWKVLASDINNEIKRVDKISLQCNTVTRVIATDNWIIKLTPYNMFIAHQSDSALILCSADTHNFSTSGSGTVQYLNIEVKTTRNGAEDFNIRCNALDYKDLEEKMRRPITILQDVTFHKSRVDMFLDVFRGLVEQNPLHDPVQVPEMCIGCMVVQSNVKLVKCCGDTTSTDRSCSTCYCRPMWCLDCMGKWWASRQEQDHPETWLSSKCTCPMCRSVFCILDICPVQSQNS